MKEQLLKNLLAGEKPFPAPIKTTRPSGVAYEFIVGIGKDHTASITIPIDAYEELMGDLQEKS